MKSKETSTFSESVNYFVLIGAATYGMCQFGKKVNDKVWSVIRNRRIPSNQNQ